MKSARNHYKPFKIIICVRTLLQEGGELLSDVSTGR